MFKYIKIQCTELLYFFLSLKISRCDDCEGFGPWRHHTAFAQKKQMFFRLSQALNEMRACMNDLKSKSDGARITNQSAIIFILPVKFQKRW
jgi:hypothetical protein